MAEATGHDLSTRVQVFARMPAQQKLGIMLLAAVVFALLAGAWLWSSTPDYRVLYASLSDRDGGAVISALQQMNVPYKFSDGGGALLVPAQHVHEVRLRLAGQGLPKGSLAGFELMENQKFGASQFLEQVNYQRALEGELARSIQSFAAVQGARVHLALAKTSSFLREQAKPSASVLVQLYPGRSLEPSHIAAISHLVSSSVPDLPARNVAVVDQNGALLSADQGANGKLALDPGQIKYRQDLEQSYVQRIEAILAPVLGRENVRAQVAATLDFTESEHAEEIFKPNAKPEEAAVRSQQSSEAAAVGSAAGGVPGALTNQPPGPVSAPITTPASGAPAAAMAGAATAGAPHAAPPVRRDSTVNYEVDKTIRHTRQQMGRIKRLSVAVVVNHRQAKDAAGKATQRPLSEAEKTQVTELVKGVMGYDKERGDSVSVMNSAFTVAEIEKAPETPLWKHPTTIHYAKEAGKHLLIAAVVLYLLLGVIRPLFRTAFERAAEAQPVLPSESGGIGALGGDLYEQRLTEAKQLAKQDPRVVANVVKNWVASP